MAYLIFGKVGKQFGPGVHGVVHPITAFMKMRFVGFVFFNPETQIGEKQGFIGSVCHGQGKIHKMGVGHSPAS
jgi:hypothetical protein